MSSSAVLLDRPGRTGADAWAALPDDTPGELVAGVLEEEEMPDLVHEVVVAWIVAVLRAWGVPRGAIVAGSEVKFVLGASAGRKPDACLFLAGGPRPPRRGAITVPPHLMVEVVSPAPRDVRRDRVEKPSEYAAFGVRHLWIIDPEARTFEAMTLDDAGRYVRMVAASAGTVAIPGLDGLNVDLDALWAEIDRLE